MHAFLGVCLGLGLGLKFKPHTHLSFLFAVPFNKLLVNPQSKHFNPQQEDQTSVKAVTKRLILAIVWI